MKVDIRIVEKLSKVVTVEASSVEEAINIVNEQYSNEEIVLDYSDFDGNLIIEENETLFESRKDFLINEIINYMIKDEEKHYEEMNKPQNHIYNKLKELQDYLPECSYENR